MNRSTCDWLDSWTESGSLPGVMLGIYNEQGEEIFFHASTSKCVHPINRKQVLPYTKEAIFRIYSMTKPITSVAAMILVERGLLHLHDEISKFIPEFADTPVIKSGDTSQNYTTEPLETPITIFHLLSHTSGITYGIFGNALADQLLFKELGSEDATKFMSFTPLTDFVRRVAKAPLAFQPGKHFQYGFNVDVLGRIIEIVSGKSLEQFFQEEIFQPLGMTETTFFLSPDLHDRVVEIYDVAPGHSCHQNLGIEETFFSPKKVFQAGGHGLFSTFRDYTKFAVCLLNKGKISPNSNERLLNEETVDLMSRNHLPGGKDVVEVGYDKLFLTVIGCKGFGFGLGFSSLINQDIAAAGSSWSIGSFGWSGYAGTYFQVDPIRKFVTIFFTQVAKAGEAYPLKQQVRWYSNQLVTSN